MSAIKRFLTFGFITSSTDVGLLVLRIGVGLSLFLKHGLEKWEHFPQMAAHFPDPVHIGSHATLLFSLCSDGISSVLIMLGLFTRWAALVISINILAAWTLVHHRQFFGHGADHGELCVLYVAACLAILCAGAGRFSLDRAL